MLGFSHLLEIVEIQPSQLHKLHNRAKHIPGQFENRKSLRVRNPTQSAAAAKVDKSVERLMFTRFSKENGSNGGGNFFVFLFCRKIACTDESSHTSHWNRCRKKSSGEQRQIKNIASKSDQKVQQHQLWTQNCRKFTILGQIFGIS